MTPSSKHTPLRPVTNPCGVTLDACVCSRPADPLPKIHRHQWHICACGGHFLTRPPARPLAVAS